MSCYIRLAKAGLLVIWDIDNPHAKVNCGCKICCQLPPVFDMHRLAYQEIRLEAKTRICSRKFCLKYGCDCDE